LEKYLLKIYSTYTYSFLSSVRHLALCPTSSR